MRPPPRSSSSPPRAVALAVERTSVRAVARALPSSPTNVTKFLAGSKPYRKTIEKLQRWFLENGTPEREEAVQDRALEILLSDFPAGERVRLREELVAELRRMHIREGAAAPPWMTD